jgi:hypothetical protein
MFYNDENSSEYVVNMLMREIVSVNNTLTFLYAIVHC